VAKVKIQEKFTVSFREANDSKVWLQGFHFNGHTTGRHVKVLLKRFRLNGNTTGFRPPTQKLELHTK